MSSELACRRAGDALVGQVLAAVTYVGLTYDDPSDVEWDFGDWHWPEVGVELRTESGDLFFAIWDSEVTHFELTFEEGPISSQWLPLQEEPSTARAWEVSGHPRWAPLVGGVVTACDLMSVEEGDPPAVAPVAIRLTSGVGGLAWIVAASPRDTLGPPRDLAARDVYLGDDEVIVVFGDEGAQRLGLRVTA